MSCFLYVSGFPSFPEREPCRDMPSENIGKSGKLDNDRKGIGVKDGAIQLDCNRIWRNQRNHLEKKLEGTSKKL